MNIPTGTAQVNFVFTGDGLPNGAQCTLGVSVDIFSGTPGDAAVACRDAWMDNLLAIQSPAVTFSEVLVKFGPTATGPSAALVVNSPGTDAGDADSPNVALLVHKQTEFGGRTGRGRMYMPGVPAPDVFVDGTINSTYRAAALAAFSGFYTDLTTANLPPLLLHGENSPVSTPLPITDFLVDGRVATQRRRLRR